jgi:hypothetical protein
MTFEEILDHAMALLQRRGRVRLQSCTPLARRNRLARNAS